MKVPLFFQRYFRDFKYCYVESVRLFIAFIVLLLTVTAMAISKTRKWFLLIFVCMGFFDFGLLLSLQPTFYSSEAEAKGARPSQYGFVFGIVNLAAFFFAPVLGRYGDAIGPKLLYNTGSLTQGIGSICFGLLKFVNSTGAFIGLSYLLRFLEGVANAACNSTITGILMGMFPGKVSSIMGYTRMFLGIGYMLGPVVGSMLYSLGGFGMPFYVVGLVTTLVALTLLFLVPKNTEVSDEEARPIIDKEEVKTEGKSLSLIDVVKRPLLMVPFLDALTCFTADGMVEAMLEPHLKNEAHASQGQVAVTFLILGSTYAFAFPLAGFLGDRLREHAVVLSIVGNLLVSLSMVFIGPLPIFALQPTPQLIYGSVAMAGTGYSLIGVSSFTRGFHTAISMGFADNMRTNLIVSGLWASCFNLGCFLGPTAAGFMVEAWGFRSTTFFYLWIYITMICIDCIVYLSMCRRRSRSGA